ncbi:MAG: DUF58 domain-containing protein [Chloroflexota bacterium]|nr:DUF58 domain-containing protein [Chloroflexota bacterium]
MQKRAVVFLALFLIASIIALQTGRRLFLSLAYLLGVTVALSLIWAWVNLRWLAISRMTQSLRAQVGSSVEELMIVRNKGWLPKLWLEVHDASELPDHHISRVIHGLGPRMSRSWSVRTKASYRGRYRLGPMQLVSGDPLGLFLFKRDLPQTSYITIYPATHELPGFAPPVGHLLGGESLQQRTHHITPNFAGVRDYLPGDALNRIHWRSTARTGRLIVKEFEEDPTADIWIVLDMDRESFVQSSEPLEDPLKESKFAWLLEQPAVVLPSTTETGVTVAASLMKHFLEQNRSVGMIAHAQEREVLQPDRGLRPLTRALEYLAVLQAEGRRRLHEVLALEEAFFTRGTTLVLVTSSASTKWVEALQVLRRRGVRAVVILIDPASFDPYARHLDEVRAALAIQSVPTYIVRNRDAIPEALSQPAVVS